MFSLGSHRPISILLGPRLVHSGLFAWVPPLLGYQNSQSLFVWYRRVYQNLFPSTFLLRSRELSKVTLDATLDMANLQKSAMAARLAKLPYLPTVAPPYDDIEDVEEREEAMSSLGSLPTMLPPPTRSAPVQIQIAEQN